MKAPFFDAMRTPLQSPTQFMHLLQEQQLDTVETSVKALSCRDPMAVVKLHQDYMQRMVERWSKLGGAAKADVAKAAAKAPAPVAPVAKALPPAPKPVAAVEETKAAVEETKAAVEEIVPTPVPAPEPAPKSASANDDLTAIKGIGPKFAQTLKDHGITSYGQLAALTPGEVEELEEKLGFSGRFAREGWIEQARALAP